ncbi:uncharacterized protein TRAVEDRAFT_42964, partial [Trametes versicolor FP-101664 SS1]|uniref:uncharacterized protein n=1 Tax=Trametes versicolor (strain FP-101664) TaxID=717944 RepID=UPI00046216CE
MPRTQKPMTTFLSLSLSKFLSLSLRFMSVHPLLLLHPLLQLLQNLLLLSLNVLRRLRRPFLFRVPPTSAIVMSQWEVLASLVIALVVRTCNSLKDLSAESFLCFLAAAQYKAGLPNSHRDAMNTPDAGKWQLAEKAEYESLLENKTWIL